MISSHLFTESMTIEERIYQHLKSIQPLHIDARGIYTLLSELDPYKASGPDNILPRLPKELCVYKAPILVLILMYHYIKASCLLTGRLPLLYRCTKKALTETAN